MTTLHESGKPEHLSVSHALQLLGPHFEASILPRISITHCGSGYDAGPCLHPGNVSARRSAIAPPDITTGMVAVVLPFLIRPIRLRTSDRLPANG